MMAQALRFHAVVSGSSLTISDLARFEGRRVEVIVLEAEADAATNSERDSRPLRRFGTMAGRIKIADDFDAPLPADIEQAFESGES